MKITNLNIVVINRQEYGIDDRLRDTEEVESIQSFLTIDFYRKEYNGQVIIDFDEKPNRPFGIPIKESMRILDFRDNESSEELDHEFSEEEKSLIFKTIIQKWSYETKKYLERREGKPESGWEDYGDLGSWIGK